MKLRGSKILLRDWQLGDLPIHEKFNIRHHKWMELDAPYYDRLSLEEFNESLNKLNEHITQNNWSNPRIRLVIANQATNQLIGTVSWYWQSKPTNWVSMGIVLYDENDWGKGFGSEALKLWCNYLFTAMPKIVRLDLRTWSGNTGMMRLGEKLGFKQETCFRNARIYKGEYYDSIGYGVLREEWENLHSIKA